MAAQNGRQRWRHEMADKDGVTKWPTKMVAQNGRQRWRHEMSDKDGVTKWPTKMVAQNGRQRWRHEMADKDGGTKWLTKMAAQNNDPIDLKLVSFDSERKMELENHNKNYILTTFLCFLANLLNSNFLKIKKH